MKRIYAISYWGHLFTVKATGPLSTIALLFLGAYGTNYNEGKELYWKSEIGRKLVRECCMNYKLRRRIYERVKAATGLDLDAWYIDNQTM